MLDNAGRLDCTVWGGILSRLAAHKRIGGTVINGVCRDTAEADEAGYPLYALGRFMRTGKDRVQVEAYEQPVSLGDVRVCNGDLLIGDDDGVVVVPQLPRRAEQIAPVRRQCEGGARMSSSQLLGDEVVMTNV
ncbi:RraA family protein [Variovorax sp. AFSI2.2]|uniref:RraA family protein n=1 Tax=Variovorax sp. AFSI2.2 TaxID=3384160 RepID=UPI003EBCD4EE